MSAFFFWTAWACATDRPCLDITYTQNWPHEPLIDNRPTADAVSRSVELAERCRFSLDELKYEYPDEFVPDGRTPQEQLVHLTWQGAAMRYPAELFPGGIPGRHITKDAVERVCQQTHQRCHIAKPITPYSLRHAFALNAFPP